MKILTIYTLYGRRAGAELFFEKIVFGMLEKFSDVSFTVYCNDEAYDQLPEPNPRFCKIAIKQLNDQFRKALWLEFISAKVINSSQADVFWIPSGTNSFPGRWRVPTVVTFLDLGEYFVRGKYDFKRTFYRKHICIPASLKRGASFTCISQTTANDLANLFGQKSFVVYPGISPRVTSQSSDLPKALVKKETTVDLDEIIFTPGRTDYIGKGLDLLINAYTTLLQQEECLPPLVLVGPPGEGHQRLQAELKRPELQGKVLWLGRVSNDCVDALYAMSKFVVFPSRYEGFGFPVLEAMQHKVPLICSAAGSLAEVAGDAAYVVVPGNPCALAMAMQHLNRNNELRQILVEKGRQQIELFNWNASYEGMYRSFSDVISR
jgi:glycosyltransferase involved in cell wall biosynthesis